MMLERVKNASLAVWDEALTIVHGIYDPYCKDSDYDVVEMIARMVTDIQSRALADEQEQVEE